MSDKLLESLFSSIVVLLIIIELGLALLLTLHNISIMMGFIKRW
ncbi:MAG: hypothetical protein QXN75_01200 [Thermoproteota archaeon]